MAVLLPIHIIAAGVGLLAGAVALSAAKGRLVHRRSGIIFVYAMIAMCASAAVAAILKAQAVNVMAALMTSYLVLTGLLTVRPPSDSARRQIVALMLVALALGVAMFAAAFVAVARPSGRLFGYPALPFFLFGVLGVAGAAGDWRTIRTAALRRAPRLARHLWRMSMAMFIATASFFSIRSRVAAVFPAALTGGMARSIPVLLVIMTMFYWLWRIRGRTIPERA